MFQNTLPSLINPITTDILFKPNATMSYHANNERNNLDSYFLFIKLLLDVFKFIYILQIIQLMNV